MSLGFVSVFLNTKKLRLLLLFYKPNLYFSRYNRDTLEKVFCFVFFSLQTWQQNSFVTLGLSGLCLNHRPKSPDDR